MDRDKLGGLFQKYLVLSPNAFVDPNYKVLARYIESTTGQRREDIALAERNQVDKLPERFHGRRLFKYLIHCSHSLPVG